MNVRCGSCDVIYDFEDNSELCPHQPIGEPVFGKRFGGTTIVDGTIWTNVGRAPRRPFSELRIIARIFWFIATGRLK